MRILGVVIPISSSQPAETGEDLKKRGVDQEDWRESRVAGLNAMNHSCQVRGSQKSD